MVAHCYISHVLAYRGKTGEKTLCVSLPNSVKKSLIYYLHPNQKCTRLEVGKKDTNSAKKRAYNLSVFWPPIPLMMRLRLALNTGQHP